MRIIKLNSESTGWDVIDVDTQKTIGTNLSQYTAESLQNRDPELLMETIDWMRRNSAEWRDRWYFHQKFCENCYYGSHCSQSDLFRNRYQEGVKEIESKLRTYWKVKGL